MLSGNSLRQTVHTHCASVHQAAKLVAALLRVVGVTAGLAESNGSLLSHVTCRVTAKNRDQLRNPMLGNRVWATFTFYSPLRCSGIGSESVQKIIINNTINIIVKTAINILVISNHNSF